MYHKILSAVLTALSQLVGAGDNVIIGETGC